MIWRKGIAGTKRGVSQPGEHGSVGRLQIKVWTAGTWRTGHKTERGRDRRAWQMVREGKTAGGTCREDRDTG